MCLTRLFKVKRYSIRFNTHQDVKCLLLLWKNSRSTLLFILICAVFAIPQIVLSQNRSSETNSNLDFPGLPSLHPVEPTTASLGRYGEYPVNYSNGIPDITISLYEIRSGDLRIPINLSYQGGGIKVSQEATWVGLGWDLSYGGQLTRVVNGFPDEFEPSPDQRPQASETITLIEQNPNALDNYSLQLQFNGTFTHSYQPDEYFYSIGGELNKTGEVISQLILGGKSLNEVEKVIPTNYGGVLMGIYSRSGVNEGQSKAKINSKDLSNLNSGGLNPNFTKNSSAANSNASIHRR